MFFLVIQLLSDTVYSHLNEVLYFLLFHQVLHYFSTYGAEMFTGIKVSKGWLPYVEDTEKTESDNQLLAFWISNILSSNSSFDVIMCPRK